MKEIIKNLIAKTGYTLINSRELRHPQRLIPLKAHHFFDLYFSTINTQDFFFVQIGAHDGKHSDPLYPFVTKYNLSGLAIEPQKDVFAQLQNTYREYQNVTCVNVAIGEKTGQQPFFTVSGDTSLATFNRNILAQYEGRIQEITVEGMMFNDLVEKYKIQHIDFLQIDCEGYDFEILKMIDFNKFSPSIINFESVLLSDTDRSACEEILTSQGYTFFRHGLDTCAYKV